MGLRWSRVGSEPYYLSYEKNFEKIATKEELIKTRCAARTRTMQNYNSRSMLFCGFWFALSAVWWGYVGRYIIEPYSRQWFICVGATVGVLAAMTLLAMLARQMLELFERRDKAFLKGLQDSRRKMLKEIKDNTHFEKTMALLRKYDPDAQPPAVPNARMQPGRGTPQGVHGPGGTGPHNMALAPGQQQLQQQQGGTPASQLLMRTGNAAAAAAMGAGKALFPVFDTLANNVIGDNPGLVQELMRTRQEADALRAENQALRRHLAHLAPDGLPPPGFNSQGGQTLMLKPPPGPPSLDTLPDNGPWQAAAAAGTSSAAGEQTALPPPLRMLQEVEVEEADATAAVSSNISRAELAAAATAAAAAAAGGGGGGEAGACGEGLSASAARQPADLMLADSPPPVEDGAVKQSKGGNGSGGNGKGAGKRG